MDYCDCPRITGTLHFEVCPLHNSKNCSMCEAQAHDYQRGYSEAKQDLLSLGPCGKHPKACLVIGIRVPVGRKEVDGRQLTEGFDPDEIVGSKEIEPVCSVCEEIKQTIANMPLNEIIRIKHANNTPEEAAEQLANIKRGLAEGEESDRREFEQKVKPLVEALRPLIGFVDGGYHEGLTPSIRETLKIIADNARAALKAWEAKK